MANPLRYALVLAPLLVACGSPSPRSVLVEFGGETLYSCGSATLSDLTPAGGGYRYTCTSDPEQSSLYVVQDTSARKDGTINSLRVSLPKGESRTLHPAIAATEGKATCEWAAALGRTTGEAPIPKGQVGAYKLAMAEPCGELTLTIGEAKP